MFDHADGSYYNQAAAAYENSDDDHIGWAIIAAVLALTDAVDALHELMRGRL